MWEFGIFAYCFNIAFLRNHTSNFYLFFKHRKGCSYKVNCETLATNTYILVQSNHEGKKIAHLQRKRIPEWIVNCVSTQVSSVNFSVISTLNGELYCCCFWAANVLFFFLQIVRSLFCCGSLIFVHRILDISAIPYICFKGAVHWESSFLMVGFPLKGQWREMNFLTIPSYLLSIFRF